MRFKAPRISADSEGYRGSGRGAKSHVIPVKTPINVCPSQLNIQIFSLSKEMRKLEVVRPR